MPKCMFFLYAWLVPLDWCLCCKEIDGLKHGSTEGRLTSVSRHPANISKPQMLFSVIQAV